jgi:hypothetical protein
MCGTKTLLILFFVSHSKRGFNGRLSCNFHKKEGVSGGGGECGVSHYLILFRLH